MATTKQTPNQETAINNLKLALLNAMAWHDIDYTEDDDKFTFTVNGREAATYNKEEQQLVWGGPANDGNTMSLRQITLIVAHTELIN